MTAVLFDFGIFLLVFGFAVGLVSSFARSISQREAADPETLPREGGAL
jgi:nitrate reductase gamma subunit